MIWCVLRLAGAYNGLGGWHWLVGKWEELLIDCTCKQTMRNAQILILNLDSPIEKKIQIEAFTHYL
jgi:hypothetical protein